MVHERVFGLPAVEAVSEHISLRTLDGLSVVVVDHPRVRAAVALQGAHLFAWQPAGSEPVLWLSEASAFREGTAIRGGVPVCWPWFGPAGQPSHGFARISDFTLEASEEDEQGAALTFALRGDEKTLAVWPHEFELVIAFRLAAECEITLEARGDFETTGALHSYFHVGDIDGVTVSGLGRPYIDQVSDDHGLQDGDLTFPDRTDRIYTEPEPLNRIGQPALKRTVEVRHHGNTDIVAWNPGPALSHSMADLTDDGYRGFVCVETARVSEPMVSRAGAPAVLGVTIVEA